MCWVTDYQCSLLLPNFSNKGLSKSNSPIETPPDVMSTSTFSTTSLEKVSRVPYQVTALWLLQAVRMYQVQCLGQQA